MFLFSRRHMTTEMKRRFIENIERVATSQEGGKMHARLKKIPSTMAVLVPLVEIGDSRELHAVFTKRSRHLKSHRGEVCFPGGKQEPDESMIETALRETVEETGLDRNGLEIWGSLSPVVTRHLTSSVTPIVAFIENEGYLKRLTTNHHEVQAVISVPLLNLAHNVGYTQFKNPKMKYKIPVFRPTEFKIHDIIPDTYLPPLKVWGLSGVMLHQALVHLLPEEYKPQLQRNMSKYPRKRRSHLQSQHWSPYDNRNVKIDDGSPPYEYEERENPTQVASLPAAFANAEQRVQKPRFGIENEEIEIEEDDNHQRKEDIKRNENRSPHETQQSRQDRHRVRHSNHRHRYEGIIENGSDDEEEQLDTQEESRLSSSSATSNNFQNDSFQSIQSADQSNIATPTEEEDTRFKVKLRRKSLHPVCVRFERDLRVLDSQRVTVKHDKYIRTTQLQVKESFSAFGATLSLLADGQMLLRPTETKRRRSSLLDVVTRSNDSPASGRNSPALRIFDERSYSSPASNPDSPSTFNSLILEHINAVIPLPIVEVPDLGQVILNPMFK